MAFPITRMRRLRKSTAIRNMLEEAVVSTKDLIYPMFSVEGNNLKILSLQCLEFINFHRIIYFLIEKVVNKGIRL